MNVLAPLGLLAIVGLLVLIVVSARWQREAGRRLYRDYAAQAGFAYRLEDDGTAESLSQGFDDADFARFQSPSLGAIKSQNVITATVAEGRLCAFTHATRDYEGQARAWFVCILETDRPLCRRGLVKCLSRQVRRVHEAGGLPAVDVADDPAFDAAFEVRAEDAAAARACLGAEVRRVLAAEANHLSFAPDIQIVGRRLAVYPGARNHSFESTADLDALIEFARDLARAL